MKSEEISLVAHTVGISFPVLYKGTREGRSNMTDKITLEGKSKNRVSTLLHSSLRAGLKVENLSSVLQMSFGSCH